MMARMPDGFVFITKVSGPKVKDGKAFADVSIDERELVMCKNCKHWWEANELCTHQRHVHGTVCAHECKATDYCSDGERRDEDG